jgi:hypothetical protein
LIFPQRDEQVHAIWRGMTALIAKETSAGEPRPR